MAEKPRVLMLGTVHHADAEFEKLSWLANVTQVTSGTRADFIRDCDAGKYDNVVAISRTYDSAAFTGLFDAPLVAHLPASLRFICHNGAGYDQIDVPACTSKNIAVSNTPSAVDAATANTAMFLILGALRRMWQPQLSLRESKWRGESGLGRDPDGLTLGILGMGGIGTATAQRAVPFGFHLQYHNRNPVPDIDHHFPCQKAPKYVGFHELLQTSDVISIHLPLLAATRGLIGAKEIAMMKEKVILVNTARGPIVDEAALLSALDSGKVWTSQCRFAAAHWHRNR
ncbi:hypothetical protein CDD82_7210 [Ophiocordyceps australis]|uniref:D-isomer specific 2-hydroxyacid dehydrogenase NAD-binding domain-containing protein n=1 Tax=Ophiocordyceps australis TaxID=1399860 RepID=A0A2C5YS15_9HYPO|nr:hypothetical protein CDD82_7210 [Ophiocordyceps australis]